MKYKLKNGNILKDGHTMFLEDVVKDLNRKAYLEENSCPLYVNFKKSCIALKEREKELAQ